MLKTLVPVGLILALALLANVAVQRTAPQVAPSSPSYKVAILGFDGLDPDFLDYLMSEGKLPNFARLSREGAYAPSRSFKPTKSVVVWTSVATGKRMEKHGIVDWMLLSEETRQAVLASGRARKTEAFWNIASRFGRTVQVLGWWATWPADPVEGQIVSNLFPEGLHEELPDATYPPSLYDELLELDYPDRADANEAIDAAGMPVYSRELAESAFRPSDVFRTRFMTSAGVFNEDMITEQSLEYLLETRGQADMVAALFRTADVFTHFMWRFIERRVAEPVFKELREEGAPLTPDLARKMKEAYARVLEPVYVHEDRRLGRLMARLEPDTVLFAASDHGFQFRNYGFNHYDHGEGGVKAPHGVLFMWGGPVRPGARLDSPSVLDITPTALYVLGLPVGKDMDGRPLTEAFRPELLAARPVTWIPTHDTERRANAPLESPVDDVIREELCAIGYMHCDPQ